MKKRIGATDEVKGKEIEILWPTGGEIQEGELRESLGQPGVSPWYVDPAKVEPCLPNDEELGDMPIEI